MRLILAGCEHTGTSTLAFAIDDWMEENIGARFSLIHDHWKLPHTSGHPQADMTEEERQQVLSLSPVLKEMTQRHSLYYHVQPNAWSTPDWMGIGVHIDDAVYSPMYFGYGADHQDHDRKTVSRQVEGAILRFAPDIVLVHVKASAEVIEQRMAAEPRKHSPLTVEDIPEVLARYEEAVADSTLRHKIALDTSDSSVEETMAEFTRKIEPHLSETDRSRILLHRDW